jgi:fatty-acid peroxygenase
MAIPKDDRFDSSLALLSDPYRFIGDRCRRFGTDLFEARILLHRSVCMTGPVAGAVFYDRERFLRTGAAPEPLQATLFGKGGVQGLDGEAHRHRKAMFMSLMAPARIEALAEHSTAAWRSLGAGSGAGSHIMLYAAAQRLLTRAVCDWAGVPLVGGEIDLRTRQLVALFDSAASLGIGHLFSRLARHHAERWLTTLIEAVRSERLEAPAGCALAVIALHRGIDGQQLPARIAAVELLNVLRPTVAVSVYIVFAVHALHEHPGCVAALRDGDEVQLERFVQEVRRFYPFFPAVAARAAVDFDWGGHRFRRGQRALFDLYGTNHDGRVWDSPDEFRPERFRDAALTPFNFVPQGGGDQLTHHRCPGEAIAVALTKAAVAFLVRELRYEVPAQDLRLDMARLPAVPHSRLLIVTR